MGRLVMADPCRRWQPLGQASGTQAAGRHFGEAGSPRFNIKRYARA